MADLKLVPAAPPGAPPGWALVPLEPTPQMLAAGQMAWVRDPLRKSSTLYRAMVGAAPHPSGVSGTQDQTFPHQSPLPSLKEE